MPARIPAASVSTAPTIVRTWIGPSSPSIPNGLITGRREIGERAGHPSGGQGERRRSGSSVPTIVSHSDRAANDARGIRPSGNSRKIGMNDGEHHDDHPAVDPCREPPERQRAGVDDERHRRVVAHEERDAVSSGTASRSHPIVLPRLARHDRPPDGHEQRRERQREADVDEVRDTRLIRQAPGRPAEP